MLINGGKWHRTVLQNAAVADGDGETLNIVEPEGSYYTLGLQVVIATTAVVNFEVTIDGSNWEPIMMTNVETGSDAVSTSATATFRTAVVGMRKFRARISGWGSGAVTVTALLVA